MRHLSSRQSIFEGAEKTMLQNAGHAIDDLHAIKIQADQFKMHGGQELSYDQYTKLLLSAASNYDSQYTPKMPWSQHPAKRTIYAHELESIPEYDTIPAADTDPTYDIDMAVDAIQAYAHLRGS